MNKLISQRYLIRENILTIVGICLCCYFTYHVAFGTRSYMGLTQLENEFEQASAEYETLHQERVALESRVARLRPDQLDRDLLEERARVMLGFSYEDERIIIQR